MKSHNFCGIPAVGCYHDIGTFSLYDRVEEAIFCFGNRCNCVMVTAVMV